MANLAVIPIAVKEGRPIRVKRGRMVILSPQEMLALLKAAKNRSTRDWAMILLAYRHGLRASEVCGVKLADVDLKAGSISIRRLKGSLQHSLASHLVAGNANLALIRQALGHRSISSTMQYIGTSDGQAAEALQKALMSLF
jgi:integrase